AAISVEARVVGETLRVIAKAQLVVGLEKIAGAEHQFGLPVSFKSGPRSDVKYSVCPVADVGGITAALDFQIVDVFGVDLRAEIAGDVGVRYFDTIDQPAHLVSAPNVQHVVRDVCAGDVVGDHAQRRRAI